MQREKRRIFSNERGQTMAETAVILPVLLMLLLAIVQFGIVFNNYVTLTDAVRAGARTAAVSRHYSDRTSRTVQQVREAAVNMDQSKLVVTVSSSWTPGSDVTVGATYPYELKLFGRAVHSGTLSSQTVERVE